jgi:hypothetical protein
MLKILLFGVDATSSVKFVRIFPFSSIVSCVVVFFIVFFFFSFSVNRFGRHTVDGGVTQNIGNGTLPWQGWPLDSLLCICFPFRLNENVDRLHRRRTFPLKNGANMLKWTIPVYKEKMFWWSTLENSSDHRDCCCVNDMMSC